MDRSILRSKYAMGGVGADFWILGLQCKFHHDKKEPEPRRIRAAERSYEEMCRLLPRALQRILYG